MATAQCHYRPGNGLLLIEATVLTPRRALARGRVLIAGDGRIACVGRTCRAAGAAVLACGDAVLSPGFINPHDHLGYAADAPRPDSGERYGHRHEWRLGLDGHARLEEFAPSHDPHVVAWGELRFVVGGTTSVVGGAMAPGLARNLDFAAGREGLPGVAVTYRVFPLDDAKGVMRVGDCDYGPHPASRSEVHAASAFIAHVAEGTGAAAENEFRCVSSARFDTMPLPAGGGVSQDWLGPRTTLIHAVALSPRDLRLVARRHASLVWSPRSNLALYGRTLDVGTALRLGINVALGADWLPTGSLDMNRELACARHVARDLHNWPISDRRLWRMATIAAARATHAERWIGGIAVGRQADLALFARGSPDAYASVVTATPGAVMLVLRGGRVLVGDGAVVDAMQPGCAPLSVGDADKRLCAEAGAIAPESLLAFGRSLYPLDYAGTPVNEPPCEER